MVASTDRYIITPDNGADVIGVVQVTVMEVGASSDNPPRVQGGWDSINARLDLQIFRWNGSAWVNWIASPDPSSSFLPSIHVTVW